MKPILWTEERATLLRKLYTEDGKSASQIAEMFSEMTRTHISRNTICGKLSRLEIFRKTDDPKHGKPKPTIKPKPVLKPRISITRTNSNSTNMRVTVAHGPTHPVRIRQADVESRSIAFLDISPDDCRYPDGDPPTFCGRPQAPGSSYCAAHHRLCTKHD